MKNNTKIIIFILAIIIVVLIGIIVYLLQNKPDLNGTKYDALVNNYIVDNEVKVTYNNEYNTFLSNLITNEKELNIFVTKYKLEINKEKIDFKKYNYVYFMARVNECRELITFKDYVINDNKITLNIELTYDFGNCPEVNKVIEIPIKKEFNNYDIEYKYIVKENREYTEMIVKKPVLYLYPIEDNTNVSVKFNNDKLLTTTYPKYNNGWNIIANKNGDLKDQNGNFYYALYWEENNNKKHDFEEGFYVEKENAIKFLEEKLEILGLNNREKNEFIMYWLPILESNEKSLIYFETTKELEKENKLLIEPKVDSLLRIRMYVKKINKKVKIKEQKLSEFSRKGFAAIEWGGINY